MQLKTYLDGSRASLLCGELSRASPTTSRMCRPDEQLRCTSSCAASWCGPDTTSRICNSRCSLNMTVLVPCVQEAVQAPAPPAARTCACLMQCSLESWQGGICPSAEQAPAPPHRHAALPVELIGGACLLCRVLSGASATSSDGEDPLPVPTNAAEFRRTWRRHCNTPQARCAKHSHSCLQLTAAEATLI